MLLLFPRRPVCPLLLCFLLLTLLSIETYSFHLKSNEQKGSVDSVTSVAMASVTIDVDIPILRKDRSKLTIGFIGCGTIASAIATGLAQQAAVPLEKIVVTRRSERKSSLLQNQFPHLVSVLDENQMVVDLADIVFLTVLPQQTSQVLRELQFDPRRHVLVSLVSTSTLDALSNDSQLPPRNVFKMICLPAVSYNDGVCLLQIPRVDELSEESEEITDDSNTALLHEVLSTLGSVVKANTDHEMSALMVPSGLMGSFYAVLRNNRDWLTQNAPDVSTAEATNLVLRYYASMIQDALRASEVDGANDVLEQRIAEQTPGGLNEQGIANAEKLGVFQSYNQMQDAMRKRISGESDGSV
jgi:pyrroline-5-carboxylate reductase